MTVYVVLYSISCDANHCWGVHGVYRTMDSAEKGRQQCIRDRDMNAEDDGSYCSDYTEIEEFNVEDER